MAGCRWAFRASAACMTAELRTVRRHTYELVFRGCMLGRRLGGVGCFKWLCSHRWCLPLADATCSLPRCRAATGTMLRRRRSSEHFFLFTCDTHTMHVTDSCLEAGCIQGALVCHLAQMAVNRRIRPNHVRGHACGPMHVPSLVAGQRGHRFAEASAPRMGEPSDILGCVLPVFSTRPPAGSLRARGLLTGSCRTGARRGRCSESCGRHSACCVLRRA